jgi:hypothetical protein
VPETGGQRRLSELDSTAQINDHVEEISVAVSTIRTAV